MSEHAFDPMPDEQEEAGSFLDTLPAPNATCTIEQVQDALASGRWSHEVPGTALWLNTSFPPNGRDLDALLAELADHGVVVSGF